MVYRRTEKVASRLVAAREAVLAAAEQCVAADGWRQLTVARVATDAGMAVGTVYRHVTDKDSLCAEVFERAAARELDAVRQAAEIDGAPTLRCEAALRTFAKRALRRPRLAYALLAEPAGPAVEEQRLAFRRGYRELFERLVRDAIEAGELEGGDARIAAAVLVGAMGEGLVGPLAPARALADEGSAAGVVDELVTSCLRSLPHHQELNNQT